MKRLSYTYRAFPAPQIEERLNEAWERGWDLHTFCDVNEKIWATAIFHRSGRGEYELPFADDDTEDEDG